MPYIYCYVALIIMENITTGQSMKPVSYKIGDIIIYHRWREGDETPKVFKCIKYDEDFGVVWYNDNGRKDTIGISSVRKANFIERLKWWLS
jgi:signal peptidase I